MLLIIDLYRKFWLWRDARLTRTSRGRDATTSDRMSGMSGMSDMVSMMGDDHMADMMSMMGASSPMGPDASMPPEEHQSHHAAPSPEATR